MRHTAILLLALCSCAGPGTDAPGSGIRGRVVLFPASPVETSPRPTKGVATTVIIEAEDGIRHVETASDGTFEVALPPGRYLVSARPPPGSMYVPVSQAVTVEDGFRTVTLVLENRLREP